MPLVARDTVLGALTLASASPRRFAAADVDVATEIGRRAALAIDNARLVRETQKAVRLRMIFLSVASHELRTPITSRTPTVERLLRSGAAGKPLSAESLYSSIKRVQHSAERLRRLTDELLDVSRLEQGRLELRPATVELCRAGAPGGRGLVRARHRPPRDGCRRRRTGLGRVGRVSARSGADQSGGNALKFGPGHPIDIRIRNAGEAAELSVRDHGVGIEPARQPFVFDRFERAVSSKHYGGLGLGLYIARRIVRAHGGDLRVESEPGRGATFTVTVRGRGRLIDLLVHGIV